MHLEREFRLVTRDREIKALRIKAQSTKVDEEAWLLLAEIDQLQRSRYAEVGSFLPAPDGDVYYFDLDQDRWFRMLNPLVEVA